MSVRQEVKGEAASNGLSQAGPKTFVRLRHRRGDGGSSEKTGKGQGNKGKGQLCGSTSTMKKGFRLPHLRKWPQSWELSNDSLCRVDLQLLVRRRPQGVDVSGQRRGVGGVVGGGRKLVQVYMPLDSVMSIISRRASAAVGLLTHAGFESLEEQYRQKVRGHDSQAGSSHAYE